MAHRNVNKLRLYLTACVARMESNLIVRFERTYTPMLVLRYMNQQESERLKNVVTCRIHSDGTLYSPFVDLKSMLNKVKWNVSHS